MSSQRVSIFQAKRNRCLSSSSILGAGSLYLVSSTIIQMVARVFMYITWVCRLVVLSSEQMPFLHEVCTAIFLLKAFQPLLVTYLLTFVLETLILLRWSFFTFQSCWNITHILTAFSITFLSQFVKKRPSTPWSFLGLSSNGFTFDHPFTHALFRRLQQFGNFFD